jgi:hypothetical protein
MTIWCGRVPFPLLIKGKATVRDGWPYLVAFCGNLKQTRLFAHGTYVKNKLY